MANNIICLLHCYPRIQFKRGLPDTNQINVPAREAYSLKYSTLHRDGCFQGGHYYSFIRDRTSRDNCWYLFNDAEVKTFDPLQIAAECFGGEMTVRKKNCIDK